MLISSRILFVITGNLDMILLMLRGFLVFMVTFLDIALGKTCEERLETPENIFDGLQF